MAYSKSKLSIIALLFVAGCTAGPQSYDFATTEDHNHCLSKGYETGSEKYAECRALLSRGRQAAAYRPPQQDTVFRDNQQAGEFFRNASVALGAAAASMEQQRVNNAIINNMNRPRTCTHTPLGNTWTTRCF